MLAVFLVLPPMLFAATILAGLFFSIRASADSNSRATRSSRSVGITMCLVGALGMAEMVWFYANSDAVWPVAHIFSMPLSLVIAGTACVVVSFVAAANQAPESERFVPAILALFYFSICLVSRLG